MNDKAIREDMRTRLLQKAGVFEDAQYDVSELRRSEWSEEFEEQRQKYL